MAGVKDAGGIKVAYQQILRKRNCLELSRWAPCNRRVFIRYKREVDESVLEKYYVRKALKTQRVQEPRKFLEARNVFS